MAKIGLSSQCGHLSDPIYKCMLLKNRMKNQYNSMTLKKRAPVTKGLKCSFHDSHENICNHCVWNQFIYLLIVLTSYDVKHIIQWDHESKTGDGTLLNHFSQSREIVMI